VRCRGRSGTPFTLFSFQDIVTSVTGVILFVTLMLVVELSQRVLGQPNDTPIEAATPVDRRQELNLLAQEIAELERQLQETQRIVQGAAQATPEQLTQELVVTTEQIRALKDELAQLVRRQKELRMAVQESAAEFESRTDINLAKELRVRAAQLLEKAERVKTRTALVFNPPLGEDKHAWLLLIASKQIQALPSRSQWTPQVFNFEPTQTLLDWATKFGTREHYFVLMIRPSGIALARQVEDALTKAGFEIGLDLIAERQSVEFTPSDEK